MRAAVRAVAVCFCLVTLAVAFATEKPASAQSIMGGGTIEEIVIEGTQRIEPATVRSYLDIEPGDPFDPERLNEALRTLFDSGLFADATLRRDNNRLIVQVQENPIINRIAFEGNSAIDNDTLRAEVNLRPRVVFTRTRVQNDVQRLRDVYRRQGRFGARIEPKVIQLEQNRVDLVFEIDEGPRTKVRGVNFIGNEAFSDRQLRREILTTEAAWWRFLTAHDTYDPDRVSFDRELLRRFYLSEGYADFRIDSVISELSPDREGFIVTFTIDEGMRYRLGDIDITTTLPDLEPEDLRPLLTTREGDWYDASRVEDSVDEITEAVGDLGYAFVDVRPRVARDRDEQLIHLTYEIEEGPRVFIERIDISGNVRTLDRVIRREFRVVEGDAFNTSKIRRSRQRIENLGFFSDVNVDTREGTQPDTTIVDVEVQEQPTGSLMFGAGFSTDIGPLGTIELRERNLLGRAQDLRANLLIAGREQQIDLSFTEPYFLDRNLSAGFDVFRTERSARELTFDDKRTGAALRTGYEIVEHWRQNWRYEFSRREITNVDDNAATAIQLERGTSDRSSLRHRLTYDTRDNRFDPTRGILLFTNNTVAGLGGNVRFAKNEIGGDYFLPITDVWTLRFGAEAGHIVGLGEDTRVLDRFFIGGSTIRGFEPSGVTPRDVEREDPVGAKQYYAATTELRFPLGLPDEFQLRGRFFVDVGAAWGVDNVPGGVLDDSSPRVSAGTGVSWRSPLGPLDLDFGFPIIREDFDRREIFRISFGTRF